MRAVGSASANRCCVRCASAPAKQIEWTWQANPGKVKDEFWIALSWAVDPDVQLGVRKWFESPYRAGAHHDPRVLPLDLGLRFRGCPRRRRGRPNAARVHAHPRLLRSREGRLQTVRSEGGDGRRDARRDQRPLDEERSSDRGRCERCRDGRVRHASRRNSNSTQRRWRSGSGRSSRRRFT